MDAHTPPSVARHRAVSAARGQQGSRQNRPPTLIPRLRGGLSEEGGAHDSSHGDNDEAAASLAEGGGTSAQRAEQGDGGGGGSEEFEVSLGGAGNEDESSHGKGEDSGAFQAVDCGFERIGDTNGVFFTLGQRHAEDHGRVAINEETGKRLYVNPGKEGRVRVLTGPMRCMCAVKLGGMAVQAEDVLQRKVVGDAFWFPDGWFAVDLGNHTLLRPTHYMLRNGGGKSECTTGWMLEAATEVEGRWWRVGDWQTIDGHENTTCFSDLADQVPGYTLQTTPPTKVDPRTGQETCTIPMQLLQLWQAEPVGELPHHTLCFKIPHTKKYFRYFRLRQKTHRKHTHDDVPQGSNNFYVQGFELYGQLRIGDTHGNVSVFEPLFEPSQPYIGKNNPDKWEDQEQQYELQWLRDGSVDKDQHEIDTDSMMDSWRSKLNELFIDQPPPRRDDELARLIEYYGTGDSDDDRLDK